MYRVVFFSLTIFNIIYLSEEINDYITDDCKNIPVLDRFDCYPGLSPDHKDLCEKRNCCWDDSQTDGSPRCFYTPKTPSPYELVNYTQTKDGIWLNYSLKHTSGYENEFKTVAVDIIFVSDDILQIKMHDAEHKRWEPPVPKLANLTHSSNLQYEVTFRNGISVIRRSDSVTVIDTKNAGLLILSDQFLQLSMRLPTHRVVGFGEHRTALLRDMNWKTVTMYNYDRGPRTGLNLYGTQPFYMAVEDSGKAHGLLLLNSNAIDVVFQPTPALTFRAVGGILNFYIFMGPNPANVVEQYTRLVGRPALPPYWSLGFHLSKYGYGSLKKTKQVWQQNRDAGIPFDVQWNDIDYMQGRNDFTIDQNTYSDLPQFVTEVHNSGMHYMMIFDAGVGAGLPNGSYPPFDKGLAMNVFVKRADNKTVFIGKVWNDPPGTAFPDFTHPNASLYWTEMMADFQKRVAFDGAWLDMNEPSVFDHGTCPDKDPIYKPFTAPVLNENTICTSAKHYAGNHYDVHNVYCLMQVISTYDAISSTRNQRPLIISRANFPGLGRYGGHWTGDIRSSWDDMRMTIPAILTYNLFGIPLVGADICGFIGSTTLPLCKRWTQLGAFYPFARNHADLNTMDQDPVSLGPEMIDVAKKALRVRYSLLPYYYTLFWRAHAYGETVVRPVFFHAPENVKLMEINDQFLIGPSLMVAPILEEGKESRKAFYPGPQKWYNFNTGAYMASNETYDVGEDDILAVRDQYSPSKPPPTTSPVTTTHSRPLPIQLLGVVDPGNPARGYLYWDDGESLDTYEKLHYTLLEFVMTDTSLESNILHKENKIPNIDFIMIYGISKVTNVEVNGKPCSDSGSCKFAYDEVLKKLWIYSDISLNEKFSVAWK